MVTFSCCMIVKNEADFLSRCLESIAHIMDEIIIVDTGSTDNTKEIAAKYTDKIYDFEWNDNFSAARNFSFSKATMDYIYAPDADEYLDVYNQNKLRKLKHYMDEDIEIVQMMYNTVSEDTVLNIKNEYRPKLFKRLRPFVWVDPIHETVRLQPSVFNSDIVITHAPKSNHSTRDFKIFQKAISADGYLSDTVYSMYATELIKCGKKEDLALAKSYFNSFIGHIEFSQKQLIAICVLTRLARLNHDIDEISQLISPIPDNGASCEILYDLGMYYLEDGNYEEAIAWFAQALDTSYILDVHTGGDLALIGLSSCYLSLGRCDEAHKYENMANLWAMPEEDQD